MCIVFRILVFVLLISGVATIEPTYAEPRLELKTDWVSPQRRGNEWVNIEEAKLIQAELDRVGCVGSGTKGLWGDKAATVFKTFLKEVGETYTAQMTVSDLLVVFKAYEKNNSECHPKLSSGPLGPSLKACDLDIERQSWMSARDNKVSSHLTEKDRKIYLGLMGLLRSLETVSINYDALLPPPDDGMQWLQPRTIPLADLRKEINDLISHLPGQLNAVAAYWAIANSKSCSRCLQLDAFDKLQQKANLSGGTALRENKAGQADPIFFLMSRITFEMIQREYKNILNWYEFYKDSIEGKDLSSRESARLNAANSLIKLIESFNEQLNRNNIPSRRVDLVATYYAVRETNCKNVHLSR